MIYLAQFVLEWEMLQKKYCIENQNTVYILQRFFNYAVYKIMCKNIVEPDQPQMTM
jgi:hypothetical protein